MDETLRAVSTWLGSVRSRWSWNSSLGKGEGIASFKRKGSSENSLGAEEEIEMIRFDPQKSKIQGGETGEK